MIAMQQYSEPVSEGVRVIPVCAVISNLPPGGLGCDIVIQMAVMEGERTSRVFYACALYTIP